VGSALDYIALVRVAGWIFVVWGAVALIYQGADGKVTVPNLIFVVVLELIGWGLITLAARRSRSDGTAPPPRPE
jgi:hypothetical protein